MVSFLKKNSEMVIAPVSGQCISIEKIKDELFSSKAMGDGFAIIPDDCIVASPVNGEIVLIAETKHAFGLKTKKGVEVLVHIGLDTVELAGKGFVALAKAGTKVKAGEPIIRFEKKYIDDQSIDMTTMVVFTSGMEEGIHLDCYGRKLNLGDVVISKL